MKSASEVEFHLAEIKGPVLDRLRRSDFLSRIGADHLHRDFTVAEGDAAFVDAHAIEVQRRRYPFNAVIIATGSRPVFPAIEGLEEHQDELWTNEHILSNTCIPESLAVVGAGAVGLEFSLRYARLGAHVFLISRSGLLPRFPRAFGARLQRVYEQAGIEIFTGFNVQRVSRTHEGLFALTVNGPEETLNVVAESVLLATGRQPELRRLHLEEFLAASKSGRLIGAGLLCRDASELIHLPAYAIDHQHTVA